MVLQNVDRYRVVEPLFEGVRVILSYLGEPYSPAYVQGISGAAFRIAGICPCTPTCSSAMDQANLLSIFGYTCEQYPLSVEGEEIAARLPVMVQKVRESIRQNRPVLVWHAFTQYEFDVVCGFDEDQGLFYGRGSYVGKDEYAQANEDRPAKVDGVPALGAIIVGSKTESVDLAAAEKAALQEAVAHAHSEKGKDQISGDEWVFTEGLLCYNRWVEHFTKPQAVKGPGDSYCQSIYSSTHTAAASFLREIAPKYPQAEAMLNKAADHFAQEAQYLKQTRPFIGWKAPADYNAEANRAAVELLGQARDEYARGIEQIGKVLPLL